MVFRRLVSWLAVLLLCGGACQQGRAQAIIKERAQAIITISPPAPNAPMLAIRAAAPTIKTIHGGTAIKVKTGLVLTNTGSETARDVSVTAYLSDDALLSPEDTALTTLQLSSYKSNGSLKVGKSFTVPLAYKIPVALADALQGKYLIFVAKADDFTADPYTTGVVIFGPIKLP